MKKNPSSKTNALYHSPAGGCVTSAPRKITGSLKTFGRMLGTKILKEKEKKMLFIVFTSFLNILLKDIRFQAFFSYWLAEETAVISKFLKDEAF